MPALLLRGVPYLAAPAPPPPPPPSPSPRIRSPTVRDVPAADPDPEPDLDPAPPDAKPTPLPFPLARRPGIPAVRGDCCCSLMLSGPGSEAGGGAEFLRRMRARDERVVSSARA